MGSRGSGGGLSVMRLEKIVVSLTGAMNLVIEWLPFGMPLVAGVDATDSLSLICTIRRVSSWNEQAIMIGKHSCHPHQPGTVVRLFCLSFHNA